MKITAALLAGGYSRRMGRDKALLPHPGHGTLLQRQLATLTALQPDELLVSCRAEQVLPLPGGVCRVHDDGTQGPLGGIAALLGAMRNNLLLVIGVDLGRITAPFLQRIVAACDGARGAVPHTQAGLEPLAAVYPKSLCADARARLAAGTDLAMRSFVQAALLSGALRLVDVRDAELAELANWNTPEDLAPPQGRD